MTCIEPEMKGIMRSESLIIYATVSWGVGSYLYTTYGNLHSKLFDRDAYKVPLELTSERHRLLQNRSILRLAQLSIRLPLHTTVSILSVALIQLTRLV
jgi:hypothetical protein